MQGHASLKRRLLLLALTTVVVVWVGASAFIYFDAREEFDEVLDAHLAQDAALLSAQAAHELDELETDHAPLLHKYARRVAFQIWEGGTRLRMHSANTSQRHLSDVESGFSDSTIDGQRWRVFSAWDETGGFLIHVAERADVREELARDIAGNLLKPLLFSLPLLALLLWIAVARGLRPLGKLAAEVERRDPEMLTPLDAGAVPREVLPLIERLNRLFARIDSTIQRERRFTADAAHELRTPVAGIKAQAQVARSAKAEAERIHALDNAILGCDRATHLIEQLLTLARVDALDGGLAESCRLRDIAAGEIAVIAPAALGRGVHIELPEGGEVTVRGNAELLRILMRNLIDNAVRHTLSGTTVRVTVGDEAGQTCLSVSDDGPGIAEQEMSRVSERFYRPADTQASGSGLGLSIVKRIAEVHDAIVRFTPADNGRGLRVSVTFRRDMAG
ncbi:MAG: sensor histidine kinase N-terminal domain-containing protein [Nitrosomonadales bacterium]|nr:sensor histidine kinase N-terminal domain-containing protein [Nitrosomonadales bacterium]